MVKIHKMQQASQKKEKKGRKKEVYSYKQLQSTAQTKDSELKKN